MFLFLEHLILYSPTLGVSNSELAIFNCAQIILLETLKYIKFNINFVIFYEKVFFLTHT